MRRDHRTLPRFPCVIRGMKRRAFTLIELLVAIGIIAVIAAIVLPVFARSRERARQSVCLSNERQLGAAFLLYAQDSDGGMVPTTENCYVSTFWPQLIFPYVRADACFACPDANSAWDTVRQIHPTGNATPGWPSGSPGPERVSYAYNENVGGMIWCRANSPTITAAHARFAPKTLGQIPYPGATVLLTDGGVVPEGDTPQEWPQMDHISLQLLDAKYVQNIPGYEETAPNPRHEGRAGVLYADGHVRAQRIESFYVGRGEHGTGEKYPGISPCLDPALGCPN